MVAEVDAATHPVVLARREYRALLSCPGLKKATGHRMEDGDLCRECGASGFAVRTRAAYEEEQRLLERAAAR